MTPKKSQKILKNPPSNRTSQNKDEESISHFISEGNPNTEEKIKEAQGEK